MIHLLKRVGRIGCVKPGPWMIILHLLDVCLGFLLGLCVCLYYLSSVLDDIATGDSEFICSHPVRYPIMAAPTYLVFNQPSEVCAAPPAPETAKEVPVYGPVSRGILTLSSGASVYHDLSRTAGVQPHPHPF